MRVRKVSFLSKITGSFVGLIIGIILIIGSFVLLYINEGRENLGKVADSAKVVTSHTQAKDGTLICLAGKLTAENYAKDGYLVEDDYLFIERYIEIYAYDEEFHSESKDKFGGSSEVTEWYTYTPRWVDDPIKAANFKGDSTDRPKNLNIQEYDARIGAYEPYYSNKKATTLQIGDYSVSDAVEIVGSEKLALKEDIVDLSDFEGSVISNDYIFQSFKGDSSQGSPKLGDIRISFNVVKADKSGIIFGTFSEQKLTRFTTPKGKLFLKFFSGSDTKSEAVALLKQQHKALTWILRFVGFLLMFLGFMSMTNLIRTFLSVIPFFARIADSLFFIIALLLSLILTTLMVVISIILHNVWLAIGVAVAIIAIIVLVVVWKRKRVQAK